MTRSRPAVLALAFALTSTPLAAQLQPYLGASAGFSAAPVALRTPCGDSGLHNGIEVRGGVERGAFAVEALALVQSSYDRTDCGFTSPVQQDGVHPETTYPFTPGAIGATGLRLRARPRGGTLAVHGGAGWLVSHDLPYVALGAGLRSEGPLRLTLDVERTEYRISSDVAWYEWRDLRTVRQVGRESRRAWEGGWSARVGLQVGV